MYIRCFGNCHRYRSYRLHTGICLVWIAGLALGFAADRFYGDVYCGLLTCAPTCQPSFWGLAVVNVFPLLISAFAAYIYPNLLYILCMLRGLSMGLGLCACARIYGQAGLMMSGLMLFSLVLFSPLLLWYWSAAVSLERLSFQRNTVICFCVALVLALADFWIIAPFLQEVMIF